MFNELQFMTIDEAKYYQMASKKCDCAVFIHYIPLIFIKNPKKIRLSSILTTCGRGMIFYRGRTADKAHKINNLFTEPEKVLSQSLDYEAEYNRHPEQAVQDKTKPGPCTHMCIPNGIEPHDGIEYLLMQRGLKRVALFEHTIPVEFITNPSRLNLKFVDYKKGLGRIYFMPGFDICAQELKKGLSKNINPFDEKHIRWIGSVLGYQPSDIDLFIEYLRERDDTYTCSLD